MNQNYSKNKRNDRERCLKWLKFHHHAFLKQKDGMENVTSLCYLTTYNYKF